MSKKILAIILALVCVLSLAACGGNGGKETSAPETTADPFDSFGEETTAAPAIEETTVAPVDGSDAAPSEATTVAPTAGETVPTTAGAKLPATKAEIVEYFNTAINSAKKDSKSIKSNFMKHALAGKVEGVPSIIDKVVGGIDNFISGYMGEDDSKANVTWSTAADKNANFPVEGETWASKLTAADVSTAQLKESGGKYMIRITTVADGKSADVKHGSGHAPKAFNVVMPAVVSDNIPGAVAKIFSIGTVTMNYPSSTVTVTVDAATGRVLTANYVMYWTINIPLGDNVVVLPFSTENDYVINW